MKRILLFKLFLVFFFQIQKFVPVLLNELDQSKEAKHKSKNLARKFVFLKKLLDGSVFRGCSLGSLKMVAEMCANDGHWPMKSTIHKGK